MYKLISALIILSAILAVKFWPNEQKTTNFFSRNPFASTTALGEKVDPNHVIIFPDDHFEHENFDIEWWYLTANLTSNNNQEYGLQWTLFRFRNPNESSSNAWSNNQLYLAHASIHNKEEQFFTEKYARGGVGNAGNYANPFQLKIDDWIWQNTNSTDELFPASLTFSASGMTNQTVSAELFIERVGPYVLHGKNGFSIKSSDGKHASHYYSAPFLKISGNLKFHQPNKNASKTINVKGDAWFDHEWTSQLLDETTEGWDWMSLHLDNGDKLMAFRMRLSEQSDYITGTYISPDGTTRQLMPEDIQLQATQYKTVEGNDLPLTWRLVIKKLDVNINVSSIKDEQWNKASIPYYEGMVKVSGSHTGKGFLELTGYN